MGRQPDGRDVIIDDSLSPYDDEGNLNEPELE